VRFCFIVEEKYRLDGMPTSVAQQLSAWGHGVYVLEPQSTASCLSALASVDTHRFDAYVLKTVSDGPGLSILGAAAANGVPAINDPRAIRLVRDKAIGAAVARANRIPFPLTYFVADLRRADLIPRAQYPLVIKPSNGSSMQDVHRVDGPEQLEAVCQGLVGGRSFLAQRYVANDGYDVKLYNTGLDAFAIVRGSPLHPGMAVEEHLVPMTSELRRIVMSVGRVFGLRIYGVDVVRTTAGWVAVDINDFPSFGSVPNAVGLVSRTIVGLAARAMRRRAIRGTVRTLARRASLEFRLREEEAIDGILGLRTMERENVGGGL
jgi:ribosomal protein S6--L-glutamate ligase